MATKWVLNAARWFGSWGWLLAAILALPALAADLAICLAAQRLGGRWLRRAWSLAILLVLGFAALVIVAALGRSVWKIDSSTSRMQTTGTPTASRSCRTNA